MYVCLCVYVQFVKNFEYSVLMGCSAEEWAPDADLFEAEGGTELQLPFEAAASWSRPSEFLAAEVFSFLLCALVFSV